MPLTYIHFIIPLSHYNPNYDDYSNQIDKIYWISISFSAYQSASVIHSLVMNPRLINSHINQIMSERAIVTPAIVYFCMSGDVAV